MNAFAQRSYFGASVSGAEEACTSRRPARARTARARRRSRPPAAVDQRATRWVSQGRIASTRLRVKTVLTTLRWAVCSGWSVLTSIRVGGVGVPLEVRGRRTSPGRGRRRARARACSSAQAVHRLVDPGHGAGRVVDVAGDRRVRAQGGVGGVGVGDDLGGGEVGRGELRDGHRGASLRWAARHRRNRPDECRISPGEPLPARVVARKA